MSESDSAALDAALLRFVEQDTVERCELLLVMLLCFPRCFHFIEDDTIARVILNLIELNPYVTHTLKWIPLRMWCG